MDILVTLFGLAFAAFSYTSFSLVLKQTDWLPPRYTAARVRTGFGLQWLITSGLFAFVLLVEDRSLASIGIQITGEEMIIEVLLGFILVGGGAVVVALAVKYLDLHAPDEIVVLMADQPPHWKVFIALTAGINEELVFRGYLIERTLELTGSVVVAGTLSSVAFALAHLPGRKLRSVLPAIMGAGVGLVVAYLLVRNVIVLAFVHAFFDALVLLSSQPEDVLEEMDTSTLDERIASLSGGD